MLQNKDTQSVHQSSMWKRPFWLPVAGPWTPWHTMDDICTIIDKFLLPLQFASSDTFFHTNLLSVFRCELLRLEASSVKPSNQSLVSEVQAQQRPHQEPPPIHQRLWLGHRFLMAAQRKMCKFGVDGKTGRAGRKVFVCERESGLCVSADTNSTCIKTFQEYKTCEVTLPLQHLLLSNVVLVWHTRQWQDLVNTISTDTQPLSVFQVHDYNTTLNIFSAFHSPKYKRTFLKCLVWNLNP